MTSKNATLDGATIICPDDEVDEFKYKIGDRFSVKKSVIKELKQKTIKDTKCQKFLRKAYRKNKIVVYMIDSYCIDINGSLCYRLSFGNKDYPLKWICKEEDLDNNFYKIEHIRFALLE